MILLKGLLICENLHNIILEKGMLRGQVHSVFKNACNIECEDLFITLLSKEKKMYPMSVILEDKEQVDFNVLNINRGLIFEFKKSEICCREKSLFITMNSVKKWSSSAETSISNCSEQQLLENIKIMGQGLIIHGKISDMGSLVSMLSLELPEFEAVSFHECIFDKSFEFIRLRFMKFIHALINADVDEISCMAQGVIGYGCGLTPAMDDFIGGLMITYIYMVNYYKLNPQQIYVFNSKIIRSSLYKTTRVSSEMLKHSSVGETNEAVQNLMAAILNFNNDSDDENHENITKSLLEVIGCGETSGTDTALGIYVALRILTKLKYRRVWLNEFACRY